MEKKHMSLNQMIVESAKELGNLRTIVVTALLVALYVALAFFAINLTPSLRISFNFIATCLIGLLYGPVVSCIGAALGDVLQYLIKPAGVFFPGWTLNAAIAGFVYGVAFYKRYPVVRSETGDKENEDVFMREKTLSTILQVVSAMGIIICFLMPFFTVQSKTEADGFVTVLEKSSAFGVVRQYGTHKNVTACVLVIAAFAVLVALLITSKMKKRVIPLQIALYPACILPLAAYSERMTVKSKAGFIPEIGFYVIIVLLITSVIMNVLMLMDQKGIDTVFLLRCFIAMAFVAVVVSGLLGTYWTSLMYGKGFWFYFTGRMIKAMIQLPVNTMLAYVIIRELKKIGIEENILRRA